MATMNTDIEHFISLVENRPVIWDKTLEIYKDKNLRIAAWQEICLTLKDDFDEMDERKRQDYAKSVVKKWNNIRDCWMRCINEKNKSKRSISARPREYVYHRQLLFLKKIATPADTHNSATTATLDTRDNSTTAITVTSESDVTRDSPNDQDCEEDCEEDAENNRDASTVQSQQETNKQNIEVGSKRSKKSRPSRQNFNEFDKKMSEFINYQMECKRKEREEEMKEDRNLLFFKSLLPSLATLKDNEILEFQSGVLNLLQSIKNRIEGSFPHSSTYNYQTNVAKPQSYFTSQYNIKASPSTDHQSNPSDDSD